MTCKEQTFILEVETTSRQCKSGETVGKLGMAESKIPVLSCEGACIRGEIARQAANLVAKEKPYSRGCHGDLFTVPGSSIAKWIKTAEKVVLIDGCFLRCHGRIVENMLEKDKLIQFDALALYKKYNEIFDPEDVPEAERKATAQQVADHVLDDLKMEGKKNTQASAPQGCCCGD